LLGSGKLACIGIAIAAGTGFVIAFLPTTWILPLAAGLLLLSGLRFPVKPMHLQRLAAYDRHFASENMEALHNQLDTYLHCRRKRRRFFSILMVVARLFHHCKVEGIENLPSNPERLIFLCNHGYLSGAVITRLYLPVPFRSWSLSDLMEPEDVEEHILRYIVEPASWLKSRFHTPAVKLLKRISLWLFDSIDSIPVYRNRLRKILQTFQLTSQALQSGDNIMIFPENPDHESLSEPGYRSDKILPFFSGFVTAVHLYHEQTGQEVTYVPCYADSHQLIIGTPFRSRKDLPFAEEKERVIALAEETIHTLAEIHGGPSRTPTSAQA
jgi:1-acyl-sn-glycerol-3-phosphate acyltransferase